MIWVLKDLGKQIYIFSTNSHHALFSGEAGKSGTPGEQGLPGIPGKDGVAGQKGAQGKTLLTLSKR